MGVQGLAEVESGRKINGFRPSEGAQRATGDQIQQKPSRNFISGPVSFFWGILGGLEVETDLNSLLYTSFTSPLSGLHTLADQLGEKGAAGAKKLRKTLIMSEKS